MINKEQKAALVRAWKLQGQILKDIGALAEMNPPIAYGCIRTAETMVDMLMVDRLRAEETKLREVAQREKGGAENENTSLPRTPAP